ncbi:7-cyano-7-deazaguanine reductase [Breznakibacter xylanolyticus]|uniref:7-cyano-7-deazaguanine reductase n=1 Tax=Breznakibacter xylanolyticus TaxID=990 RepID=A0A2W7NHZ7_9BACT|nr:NADPH-dependent 7-cyano-7-deazaguanine reductase QueF [Breznakibacter xylanolyticus]PZX20055.1 7-cyano-7-deazaguanine reductase [Breznakibacter xylanolyticus]
MTPTVPIEATLLGKHVEYPATYAPQVLVAVPRQLNRTQYAIDDKNLPFTGYDVWHAWEAGFLTRRGLPVAGVLKIIYPANNPVIVESKSLKLYLNSFNMERLGNTPEDGIREFKLTVQRDLATLLQTDDVRVELFTTQPGHLPFDFHGFKILETLHGADQVDFAHYTDTPALLRTDYDRPCELRLATHLLRSNCKITHQPDWGSAYIHIKANVTPNFMSILQYIVSLRNENHFHEEICEMLFTRLHEAFNPEQLMVVCIYTRRGGIDICPVRASHAFLIPPSLTSHHTLSHKLLRQ